MANALPALLLLALGIILVLTGQPSASVLIVDAGAGDWSGMCDAEPVALVVEAALTDTTGILVLPCEVLVDVWRDDGEWIGDGGCSIDWREE